MLLIKNYVDDSPVHGKGVFAAEDVAAGTLLWREGSELIYSPEAFARLSADQRDFVLTWGWKDKFDGLYHLPLDNDRFINHSEAPNTFFDSRGLMLASRRIYRGEEILCNYAEFEAEFRFASKRAEPLTASPV